MARPEYAVWARQVAKQKKGLAKVSLEEAITSIDLVDTLEGSSSFTVSVVLPNWDLLGDGFFDAQPDGKLDPVDVNYPEGSRFWWRLTSIDLNVGTRKPRLSMTFMERPAVYLMQHRGPVKVSRAKRTRAQFLKRLASEVKAGGGIRFHSHELNVKQTIAKPKSERDRKKKKTGGISPDDDITIHNWDGADHKLSRDELHNAQIVLDEAFQHTNDGRTLLALLAACIVEAPFFANPRGGDASSVGILQLLDTHGSVEFRRDIPNVVKLFVLDGFTGRGGAADLAKQNPDWSIGQVAQAVQGSGYPDRYDKVRDGAQAVLDAYGGQVTASTYRKQYNFEVGGVNNPRETYWDAMRRLADEVNWALFLDGRDLYFDDERVLIRQKPVGVIKRGAPEVVSVRGTWDARQIATECECELFAKPFQFRAGEVLKLQGFGPLSSGSVVKLPGRWLIEEIRYTIGKDVATFRLKQPEREKREPAPELGTRKEDADGSRVVEGSPKYVIDHVVIPIANDAGVPTTVAQIEAKNRVHPDTTSSGNVSDHSGPPSVRWAADLSNGFGPTPEMDVLAKRLARRFGIAWTGSGGPKAEFEQNGWRYRVQLIYRTAGDSVFGDHMDHVHLGILLLKAGKPPSESGDGPFFIADTTEPTSDDGPVFDATG